MEIAVIIMIKNESKRILTTLNSLIGKINNLIILDTGSEDNSINLVMEFCQKNNITLFIKETIFQDFETSRNELLDFADTLNFDYYILLDCNDEIIGNIPLKFEKEGYLIEQKWFSGETITFWNVRLIKSKSNWRFSGKVHEYLHQKNNFISDKIYDFYIFQDRTKDDDKTFKRFETDKKILLKEYSIDPTNARTVFYLAQTFLCLGDFENAKKYYLLRSEMQNGFFEEIFQSFFQIGKIENLLGNKNIEWYFKSLSCLLRVEPLLKIVEYYIEKKDWNLAFIYCKIACELDFPIDNNLFIDRSDYDYKRWHLMGIIGFYCQKFKEGKNGCLKAIENKNNVVDLNNLKFYE